MIRRLLVLLPAILPAACGQDTGKDSRTASGEVLQGTISDAMLPLDTVKSQAPLADPGAHRAANARAAGSAAAAPAEGAVPGATPSGAAPAPGFDGMGGN